jgi:hypothetical protein
MNNMKDEKLQSSIEEIKKIKMTSDEKNSMLTSILNSDMSLKKSLQSPWMNYSFISRVYKSKFVYYGAVVCLIVLIGGREVVFASETSLPGNALYPIKVNIIEPIGSVFKFSTEAKAEYESSLATKRLVEAEALASEDKLDASKEKELNNLLSKHTRALDKNLNKLKEDKSSDDKVDDIVVNFQAGMNAHASVLDVIDTNENTTDDNEKISNNARSSGSKIRGSINSKDENKQEKYKKRKEIVKHLIDSTAKDLEDTNVDTSKVRQTIINDTHKTLDKAKKLLDDTNKENKDFNSNDDYSALLDSESSAKEANIFLKAGLKLKERNNRKIESFQKDNSEDSKKESKDSSLESGIKLDL